MVSPTPGAADVRTLNLPNGEALRFRKGPGMSTWISETEVPRSWLMEAERSDPTFEDALAMCRWVSEQTGQTVRLPSKQEWQQAARGGIRNLPYAWGYDLQPPSSIHFARDEAPERPGPAFGWGFHDLAGGTWEWTQEGFLIGSAWSETNPETLRIDHHWKPPPGYGDLDTGIRFAWED